MRYYVISLFITFSMIGHTATRLSPDILAKIPEDIQLNDSRHEKAKLELEELISNCGEGVVSGLRSAKANTCAFQITLDREYFENHENRTGFVYQRDWAQQDGVTFYEPPSRAVPDNFDLRDLMKNGQPVIKQQKCGDCWAWATHHGMEITRAVHDQVALDLSIQTVLSCSKQGTCNGGYMSAVDFIKRGLPSESVFPYAGSDKSCKFANQELTTGWEPKVQGTPYVGSSMDYSLGYKGEREGSKVQKVMEAMYEWKSPVVVTVASYSISGNGVYDSCSAINSGGNHMVDIVGWEMWNGKRVAHVWNSHGQQHGEKGVSRIVWECGDGKLNRGLAVSAKIVQYKPACVPPEASQVYLHELMSGSSIQVGAAQKPGTTCSWMPREGLDNPDSCVTTARPKETTEYHLTAKNDCGTSSSMTLIHVWGRDGQRGDTVLTPFGRVTYRQQ